MRCNIQSFLRSKLHMLALVCFFLTVSCGNVLFAEDKPETYNGEFDDQPELLTMDLSSTSVSSVRAHLSNDVLRLYFNERYSDNWSYNWTGSNWGESCWREHYAVRTGSTGTMESSSFTILQSFTNPEGGPGSTSCVVETSSGSIRIKRTITLPPGTARYFQIIYEIQNTGTLSQDDVRFFETIDFDIPWTGHHGNDLAYYMPGTDYIYITDPPYFQNGIASNITSDRHGMAHYYTELFYDWDDGQLNNANNYGPGDPAIGKQFNLGTLNPGDTRTIILTIWFGEPTVVETGIEDAWFDGGSKARNHTSGYSGQVFRRASIFTAKVKLKGNVDRQHYSLRWQVTEPGTGRTIQPSKKSANRWDDSSWAYIEKWEGDVVTADLFAPPKARIGKYTNVKVALLRNDGNSTSKVDAENLDDFTLIFNPFKITYGGRDFVDGDVFPDADSDGNGDFGENALSQYSSVSSGWNYYDSSHNGIRWTFEIGTERAMEIALSVADGKSSAKDVATELSRKCTGKKYYEDGILQGNWFLDADGHYSHFRYLEYKVECAANLAHHIDWQSTQDMLEWWENWGFGLGQKPAKYGQCMDFSGITSSLLRVVGIPVRMLVTLNPPGWNYHCWNELWITSCDDEQWCDIDSTPGEPICGDGPVRKDNSSLLSQIGSATAMYARDAQAGQRECILDEHTGRPCSGEIQSAMTPLLAEVSGNLAISAPPVTAGEDINISVSLTNDGTQDVSTQLNVIVEALHTALRHRIAEFPERIVTIPAGETVTELYTVRRDVYIGSGRYLVSASAAGHTATAEVEVVPAHTLDLTAPQILSVGDTDTVALMITNGSTVPTSDLLMRINVIGNVSGPESKEIPIGVLAPGAAFEETLSIGYSSVGPHSINVFAHSTEGGVLTAYAVVDVFNSAAPSLQVALGEVPSLRVGESASITFKVWNNGPVSVDGVVAELQTDDGLIVAVPRLSVPVLSSAEETVLSWTVQANRSGLSHFSAVLLGSEGPFADCLGSMLITQTDTSFQLNAWPQVVPTAGTSDVSVSLRCTGTVNVFMETVASPGISFSLYDDGVPILNSIVQVEEEKTLLLRLTPQGNEGTITINAEPMGDPLNTTSLLIGVGDNRPPVADAGPDQIVPVGDNCFAVVALDGTGSSDPDGDPLTYTWTWDDGSGTGPASGVNPTINLPIGTFTITLVVNDGTEDSEPDEVDITVEDTTPPATQITSPVSDQAIQDGVILTANASDVCDVAEVYFYVREADGGSGTPIGYEDLPGTHNGTSWEYNFDTNTPQTPDGYYVILTKAIDTNGNEGWSTPVPVSIRNWAVIELLPNTANNKAGRTMPVKFALRVAAVVDPMQPFVYNEELEIKIYDASDPGTILQTSRYGDSSSDYRIDSVGELYITNFKTSKKPAQYAVEIWRMSKNFLVGSFTFETVK